MGGEQRYWASMRGLWEGGGGVRRGGVLVDGKHVL